MPYTATTDRVKEPHVQFALFLDMKICMLIIFREYINFAFPGLNKWNIPHTGYNVFKIYLKAWTEWNTNNIVAGFP